MKPVSFVGDALEALRSFPEAARRSAGFQIDLVQRGFEPYDWKPMPTIGKGVREIRVREKAGAFRVIYCAQIADAIYVLHAFQKRTQATTKRDIDLAAQRYRDVMRRMQA
jgi:phage-related protein